MPGVVAEAEIDIAASAAQVWQALTDPEVITQYFFGTTVRPTGRWAARSSGRASTKGPRTRTRARSWRSSRVGG